MPQKKSQRTKVRTGVTTGTAVAMLFLSASAAFAAAAFTKVPMKTPFLKSVIAPDLAFIVDKPGVAVFSDQTTLQLQAVYRNTGSVEAGKHQSSYYFMDKNKAVLPGVRMDWGVDPIPAGGIKEVDVRVANVPGDAVYIGLGVDTTNNVSESSETNNEMVIALARPSVAAQPGAIAMRLGDDTPISRIIVGGTNDVPMLKVRFIATGEAFTVKKLRIFNDTSADDTGISQVKLTYPTVSGAMETKTLALNNAVADFQGLNMFVPANGEAALVVSADLLDININGISGDTPQFGIDYNSNFEAVGQSSGMSFTYSGFEDTTGYVMVVRKTKPTITLASQQPSPNGTPGLNEVLRFSVAADAHGMLEFSDVAFKVSATDQAARDWNTGNKLTASKFNLYDTSDPSIALPCTWTMYQADGVSVATTEDVNFALCVLANKQTIGAGSSKNYALKIDTSGASSITGNSDVILIGIPNYMGNFRRASFLWNETGAGAVPSIDDRFVKNLPLIGNVIHY